MKEQKLNNTVATVNGRPITEFELNSVMQELALQLRDAPLDDLTQAESTDLQKAAMEKLLVWELILQASGEKGGAVTEEEVAGEMRDIVGHFSSQEEFFGSLEQAGVAVETFRRSVLRDLTVEQVSARMIAEAPEPSAEQVRLEYSRYLLRQRKPPRVRARHLLIKAGPDARERIRDLQGREGDFAELAANHSECSSASAGGDLGWFEAGEMEPAFEEAAFSQPIGVVGEVVETRFGFHLIKVEERQEDPNLAPEEAAPRIRKALREQAGIEGLRAWVAGLKSRADIVCTIG